MRIDFLKILVSLGILHISLATVAWSESTCHGSEVSFRDIRPDGDARIIGHFKLPVGQIITLEGKRAPNSKVTNAQSLRVEKVNGKLVFSDVWGQPTIQISNVESLPEMEPIVVKGYEFLGWRGSPVGNWNITSEFIITDAIQPRSMEFIDHYEIWGWRERGYNKSRDPDAK
jgi:hypothetical protein